MGKLKVTGGIAIDEDEIEESFIQASGPGGQHVNKVATAVQLRFAAADSPSLPAALKLRLAKLAGRRMTQDGVLLITAKRFRTQERNREDAREKLLELLRAAAVVPVVRRKTKPTLASKERRLDSKTRRASVKRLRRQRGED